MKNSFDESNFIHVDVNLDRLGLTEDEKKLIYMVLSSILNLGNIKFDTTDDQSCYITSGSEIFLDNASRLLDIDRLTLEDALTRCSREIGKQHIK